MTYGWIECLDDPFAESETPFYEDIIPHAVQTQKPAPNLFSSPKRIFEYLDSQVYGHTEYKKQLAFFIWQIKNEHHPSALLIAGNSGEGKTETIRALQRIYKNIAITDGASVTPQGYKGASKIASNMNLLDLDNPSEPPIYVIDEADKLICRGGWNNIELTAELLKIMEDGIVDISPNEREQHFISTQNISFILLGSFSSITDNTDSKPIGFNTELSNCLPTKRKSLTISMIKDQLTPELIGRIGNIVILDPLSQSDYEKILKDKRYSPVQRFENEYGIHIQIKPDKQKQLAKDAYKNQTGVRYISNEISRCLMNSLFDDPSTQEISI